jgi:ligand-binding SRPBCC domain-containing protein
MKLYTLDREQLIERPRSEVFEFFADAANLERITPAFLRFRIATPPPITIAEGTLIDYRLSLFGIPFGWRTRIERFEPSRCFVDTSLKGPYKVWNHTHTFTDVPGGTRMTDRVVYALPLGPLGTLAHGLMVRRMLEAIFDFRVRTIAEIFGQPVEPHATRRDLREGAT